MIAENIGVSSQVHLVLSSIFQIIKRPQLYQTMIALKE